MNTKIVINSESWTKRRTREYKKICNKKFWSYRFLENVSTYSQIRHEN